MNELWRPVVGYEDLYEVSNQGRVKSLYREVRTPYRGDVRVRSTPEKILKGEVDRDGYAKVRLSKEGKSKKYMVHALVAAAFIGPRPEGAWVLHGPAGNKDNSVLNLSYGSPQDNYWDRKRDGTLLHGEKNYQAKLTEEKVRQIRHLHRQGESQYALGKRFDVSSGTIKYVLDRKSWKHVV